MSRERTGRNPLILVLLLLVIVAMAGVFVFYQIDNKRMAQKQQMYEQMLLRAKVQEDIDAIWQSMKEEKPIALPGEEETELPEEVEPEPIEPAEPLMDFAYLHEQNQDIVAWLSIPDTTIDYPVLQSSDDDDYYLHHNLDGSQGYPGCIFIEGFNSKDFTDSLTIAYGHRMRNGTMFAPLINYQDPDFFAEHSEVIIYLPDHNIHYQVVASSQYSDQHVMIDSLRPGEDTNYNFTGMTGEEAVFFMYRLRGYKDKGAIFTEGADITEEDTLLVLSTCSKATNTKRFLVVCKKL